jgi:hypothetical protein
MSSSQFAPSQGTKQAVLTNKTMQKGPAPLVSKTQSLASNHSLLCSGSNSVKGNGRKDGWKRHRQLNGEEPVTTELLVAASLNQRAHSPVRLVS